MDGLITSAVAVQRDYFKSTWLKASKEVGLELGFGRWACLNEWRERISRKAANVSCTKKSVFFRRACVARASSQQISILLDLKDCIKFQEACRAMVCAH